MANGKATKELGRCLMWDLSSMGSLPYKLQMKLWTHIRKKRTEKTNRKKKKQEKLIAWTTFGSLNRAICIAISVGKSPFPNDENSHGPTCLCFPRHTLVTGAIWCATSHHSCSTTKNVYSSNCYTLQINTFGCDQLSIIINNKNQLKDTLIYNYITQNIHLQ